MQAGFNRSFGGNIGPRLDPVSTRLHRNTGPTVIRPGQFSNGKILETVAIGHHFGGVLRSEPEEFSLDQSFLTEGNGRKSMSGDTPAESPQHGRQAAVIASVQNMMIGLSPTERPEDE